MLRKTSKVFDILKNAVVIG